MPVFTNRYTNRYNNIRKMTLLDQFNDYFADPHIWSGEITREQYWELKQNIKEDTIQQLRQKLK